MIFTLRPGIPVLFLALVLFVQPVTAKMPPPVQVEITAPGDWRIVDGQISGYQIIDYEVQAPKAAVLSVDMKTSNASSYFNILPHEGDKALFVGSSSGSVADVRLKMPGLYRVRVYLMRNAARRGATARYSLAIGFNKPEFADSLVGGPDYWRVSGLERGSLNLRKGPDTRYGVVTNLRNGTVLRNQGCRISDGSRWCRIRVHGSGHRGWVSGQYLVETYFRAPAPPPVGPVGNGGPFDATGFVSCVSAPNEPAQSCPFGVIRDGPGNAGVWIKKAGSRERHILFEAGQPVTANMPASLSFSRKGDLFEIQIGGERYAIPDAIVFGG